MAGAQVSELRQGGDPPPPPWHVCHCSQLLSQLSKSLHPTLGIGCVPLLSWPDNQGVSKIKQKWEKRFSPYELKFNTLPWLQTVIIFNNPDTL